MQWTKRGARHPRTRPPPHPHRRAPATMTTPSDALQIRPMSPPAVVPSIALALGGGGARGLAHILMLEVFEELGLRPNILAGTSIGALFGAAYASGLSAKMIRAQTEEAL